MGVVWVNVSPPATSKTSHEPASKTAPAVRAATSAVVQPVPPADTTSDPPFCTAVCGVA